MGRAGTRNGKGTGSGLVLTHFCTFPDRLQHDAAIQDPRSLCVMPVLDDRRLAYARDRHKRHHNQRTLGATWVCEYRLRPPTERAPHQKGHPRHGGECLHRITGRRFGREIDYHRTFVTNATASNQRHNLCPRDRHDERAPCCRLQGLKVHRYGRLSMLSADGSASAALPMSDAEFENGLAARVDFHPIRLRTRAATAGCITGVSSFRTLVVS
jgi:hypothetical protein